MVLQADDGRSPIYSTLIRSHPLGYTESKQDYVDKDPTTVRLL